MTEKKPIPLEKMLYAAFVNGMRGFHLNLAQNVSLNEQELINLMHAEARKYVIERMKRKQDG